MAETAQIQSKDLHFVPKTWKGGFYYKPHSALSLLTNGLTSGPLQMQAYEVILSRASKQGYRGENGKYYSKATASAMTIQKFAVACGCDPTQVSGLQKALNDGEKRTLWIKTPHGKSWMKDGQVCARAWDYTVDPNNLHNVPVYVPPSAKAEPEPALEESLPTEASVSAFRLKRGGGSVTHTCERPALELSPINDSPDLDVTVTFGSVDENGKIEVRIKAVGKVPKNRKNAEGEEKANGVASKEVNPKSTLLQECAFEESAPQITNENLALPAAIPAPPSILPELETFLAAEIAAPIGEPCPPFLLRQIAVALADVPPESYRRKLRARAPSWPVVLKICQALQAAHVEKLKHTASAREPTPIAPTPKWENAGSWDGDQHHWGELREEDRVFYRKLKKTDCAVLDAALEQESG